MKISGFVATCLVLAVNAAAILPCAHGRHSRVEPSRRPVPDLKAFAGESYVLAPGQDGFVCVASMDGVAPEVGERRSEPAGRALVRAQGNITVEVRFGNGLLGSTEARDAFVRAVEIWCSLVEAPQPVTLVLDADFGPTVFGSTVPLGQARIQPLIGRAEYAAWRSALVDSANTGRDLALYASLPEQSVPTDIGPTDIFVMPSAVLRVAGLLPPVTDPEAEMALYGPPPSIEIRSTAPWDFNPDDGIGSGSVDFVGVALHEIGHVIGFTTRCGTTETNPNNPVTVSAFDVFRFRPGIGRSTFQTAPRILTAGGDQVHFSDGAELALSTARLNLSGGDGFSGDHWKDDTFTGIRLGIMDPQQRLGLLLDVTGNDVQALRAMGYRLVGMPRDTVPYPEALEAVLDRNTLLLTGAVHDVDGDVETASISLLDGDGTLLNSEVRKVENQGERVRRYQYSVAGLEMWPTAVTAGIVFRDSDGNESQVIEGGFGGGDEGGPVIRTVAFNGRRLTIRGSRLNGQSVEVEVNGSTTTPGGGARQKKVRVQGSAGELGLNPGPNRIRLVRDGLRSNAVVLDLR